jgi:hypothetical protein
MSVQHFFNVDILVSESQVVDRQNDDVTEIDVFANVQFVNMHIVDMSKCRLHRFIGTYVVLNPHDRSLVIANIALVTLG